MLAVCMVKEFSDLSVLEWEGRVNWYRDQGLCFRPVDPSVQNSEKRKEAFMKGHIYSKKGIGNTSR